MSIYSSSNSWNCPATNQSPINLSQATSKPCELLCELTMDTAQVSQANVIVSDEGLILQSTSGLGTCKYNSEGYTCNMLLLNHPSHHTIENIQADAEVVAIFTNPSGKYLCVSSLVRVNSAQTPSSKFFNSFIGFANPSQQNTKVILGDNWSLNMMVPQTGAHYVYDGSLIAPPCTPSKWVVFKSMINIDPNDFALLVKNVSPGSRQLQGLDNREVYFNDIDRLPGAPMTQDDRRFAKFKLVRADGSPLTSTKAQGNVQQVPLKGGQGSWTESFAKWAESMGGLFVILNVIIALVSFAISLYFAMKPEVRNWMLSILKKPNDFGAWIRSKTFDRLSV